SRAHMGRGQSEYRKRVARFASSPFRRSATAWSRVRSNSSWNRSSRPTSNRGRWLPTEGVSARGGPARRTGNRPGQDLRHRPRLAILFRYGATSRRAREGGSSGRDHRHLRGPLVLYQDDGSSLTAGIVQGLVRRAAQKAGLHNNGPHMLRHTFCSHLAMRGAPARAIQELAGHQNLTTTQRYMHLSPAALDRAIRLL